MKRIAFSIATMVCASLMASDAEISANTKTKNTQTNRQQASTPVFNQGDDMLSEMAAAGYNAPAGVALKNNYDWMPDGFIDVSFLYYWAGEDGLGLANSGQIVQTMPPTYGTANTMNSVFYTQDSEYQPAFKIGLGTNFCEWVLAGEYTWIRQKTTTTASAPAPAPIITGIGSVIQNDWFEQSNPDGSYFTGTALSSEWRLGIDLADLTAGRPFYEGKNLTVFPFFGFRGAWIRQTVNFSLTTSPLLGADVPVVTSRNNSNSWGIGPRTGFGADCLLGMGFRLEGTAAFSILYTDFTHVKHAENVSLSTLPQQAYGARWTSYHTVRPEIDLGLGFGWGTYLDNQWYHIDFSVAYDFITFFSQNQIRSFLDELVAGVGTSSGNLYLHGLDITARFDF